MNIKSPFDMLMFGIEWFFVLQRMRKRMIVAVGKQHKQSFKGDDDQRDVQQACAMLALR